MFVIWVTATGMMCSSLIDFLNSFIFSSLMSYTPCFLLCSAISYSACFVVVDEKLLVKMIFNSCIFVIDDRIEASGLGDL